MDEPKTVRLDDLHFLLMVMQGGCNTLKSKSYTINVGTSNFYELAEALIKSHPNDGMKPHALNLLKAYNEDAFDQYMALSNAARPTIVWNHDPKTALQVMANRPSRIKQLFFQDEGGCNYFVTVKEYRDQVCDRFSENYEDLFERDKPSAKCTCWWWEKEREENEQETES